MAFRRLLSGVAVSAMMLAYGSHAQAADVATPYKLDYDWSGIYFGVHAGGIASNTEGVFENGSSDNAGDLGALSTIGAMGGAQVGWNWQAGDIVFGLEGDISAVGLGESRREAEDIGSTGNTTEGSFESDFLATVRGRVGWAADDLLFYATGGIAFLEGNLQVSQGGCTNCDEDISETGGIVGLGLEWGATENVSVKVEGLYAFFDDSTSLEDLDNAEAGDFFEVEDLFITRIGVNYRFNMFGSHAQAADVSVAEEMNHDWSGIYFGVHAGGIASNTDGMYENDDSDDVIDLAAMSTIGAMGGAQVGWNLQTENIVFGIEADISAVDLGESRRKAEQLLTTTDLTEGSFESDFLATVRGRVGWAADDVLLYATGGIAFLEGNLQFDRPGSSCSKCDEDISQTGGIVGLGLEWGATENVGIKVEGLYAVFDDETSLEDLDAADAGDFFEVQDLLIARIGVNYRFYK